MAFIQIIVFRTDKIDEMRKLDGASWKISTTHRICAW
jgi:hypothetical protein